MLSWYDEGERHRVVFEAARGIPGPKIFLAIDSDEILSANWSVSEEWRALKQLPPGTAIYAEWANVCPDFQRWWPMGGPFIIGYVDDGKIGYSPGKFHVPRLLPPKDGLKFYFREIKLLHLQYTDVRRSQSKRYGYQVQEWIEKPRRPLRLFRRFHPMESLSPSNFQHLKPAWTEGFKGFNWKGISIDGIYRWDREVTHAIALHGPEFFRRLDIWDADWAHIAEKCGVTGSKNGFADPRSVWEKIVFHFLRRTQRWQSNPIVRGIQQLLRLFGW